MGVNKKKSKHGKNHITLSPEPETNNCICYWNVFKVSLPQILTTVSFQVTNITTVVYIGHNCSNEIMAGMGMGQVIIGAFCMAFCYGLNGTLESKVSQSFGAQNYEMCGVWLNRGRAINTILMIPMVFFFFSSKHILEAIGIAEELAINARFYCCLMIPGNWAMTQFDATKRYCTSQLKSNPPFVCQLVTSLLHFAWCTIFIQVLQWQLVGAAISMNITNFLNMIALDLYIRFSKEFEGTHVPHDSRSLQEWPVYLRIGLYGAILECLGWWNLHICFLFSGYLGTTSVSTQVIIMQIKNFTTMIPTGVAFAASGFVGNCMGMN